MNKRLLPVGFYDLSAQEALKSYQFTKQAIDKFISRDYQLIKTSMIEFEQSFHAYELNNVFKIIDPVSQRNIFFRNDITLQIAKYISTLDHHYEKPLKLCYFGEVLSSNNDELYSERQQTQLGCEIIGDNNFESYSEVISDTLSALNEIDNLILIVSLPDFLTILLNNIDINQAENLSKAIKNKNLSEVKEYSPQHYEMIKAIILGDSDFENLSDNILQKFSNNQIEKLLNDARKLKLFINKNFKNITINFDIFGDNKFNYHTQMAFDIFAPNLPYPIARGGCYSIDCISKSIEAVGATIYVNYLRKIV